MPMEAGMFVPLMEKPSTCSQRTYGLGNPAHHVSNNTSLFEVTKIHVLIKESFGSIPATINI